MQKMKYKIPKIIVKNALKMFFYFIFVFILILYITTLLD